MKVAAKRQKAQDYKQKNNNYNKGESNNNRDRSNSYKPKSGNNQKYPSKDRSNNFNRNESKSHSNKSFESKGYSKPVSSTHKRQQLSQFQKTASQHQSTLKPATLKPTTLQQLPTIQQLLGIAKQDRLARSSVIFQQVKPFLLAFMQKKQGSRVTQLLFKWGNNATKTIIYKEIIKGWKDLIKSNYALYTIAKVSKEFQLPGLVDDLALLQNNREGAQILENFIHSNPQSQVVKKLKEKIYAIQLRATQNQQIKDQQLLDNFALKSIEKQYYWFTLSKIVLRLRLSTMFQEEKQKTMQVLVQNVANIVGDQQGVRLFIQLINNCSSKEKKTLIKQYKGHIQEIVKANNVSYVSVIKLMTQTDDTVLINKSFEQQILILVPQILTCKKAFSLIFSFFSPRNNNFNILGKYEPSVLKTSCKKSQQVRKQQLRGYLYSPLICFLQSQQNLSLIIKSNTQNKLLVGIYKSMEQDNHPQYQSFITMILKYFLVMTKDSFKSNTFATSIVADGNGSKVLKSMLTLTQDFVEFYCDQFAKLFVKNIQHVLQTRASFILLAILEKGGRDQIVKEIVRTGVKFDKCIAGQHFVKLIQSTK